MASGGLDEAAVVGGKTPRRLELAEVAAERFRAVLAVCERLGGSEIAVEPAYSVKTNPKPFLLRLAREHGFKAEVIGRDELAWVEENGFSNGEIVYNGPEPAPARPPGQRLGVVFADSVEAFERSVLAPNAEVQGVRLRPSRISSRFGVSCDQDARLRAVIADAPLRSIGVSMHVRPGDYAGATWLDLCDELIVRASAYERESGCAVTIFDVGGGRQPHEFDAAFERDARALIERLQRRLPAVRRLLLEPGQAIATPAEALVSTVLEVRRSGVRCEAILDLGYNDWPQMHSYVHGFAIARDGRWAALGRGHDRLAGRTCLEYDYIDGIALPPDVRAGDTILIRDAGSYDSSMAFSFGRGR